MNQPLAYIHPEAKIARNVVIEPFTTINKNVTIGSGTYISSNVTIMEGSIIGENCKIFPGAVIGAIPQDLKFEGEDTVAIIGNNTTIRECATVNRGTKASGKTVVGENCTLMASSHVAHDCVVGNNVILVNGVLLGGHVKVDDYAILGGLAAIHQFVHIGKHTMLMGGSLVSKDVPPYVKGAKFPVSYMGINSIGLRRNKFENSKINEIQDIYRILYQKNYNTTQAVEKIEAEMPATVERDEILIFIKNSQRGIMKGYTGKIFKKMASTSDIRNGLCINYNNDIFKIVEFLHVKPGKGPAFVRTKLKSLTTGKVIDNTFSAGHKIDEVRVETRKYQYLYAEGTTYHFMDTSDYNQISLEKELLDAPDLIKEGEVVTLIVRSSDELPLSVEMPISVILEVTYTEPAVKGNTTTNATKSATVETGAVLQVPLFINQGDKIKIDTSKGSYLERCK